MILGYYSGFYMMWDPTYILVVIGAVICLIASARVKTTYAKYEKVRSRSGKTGAQVAEEVLYRAGVKGVAVKRTSGNLTDHYNPKDRTLYLSDTVYGSSSVAAIGVACHEAGHAIQHDQGYFPLQFRNQLVPVANFGSIASWPLIIIGIFFNGMSVQTGIGYFLLQLGIVMFALSVLFQVVTLPVEFNASTRAIHMIEAGGYASEDELRCTKKVLRAAALTYVASAAAAILQLLRLILLFGGRRRDD